MGKQPPHCTRRYFDEVVLPLEIKKDLLEAERDRLQERINYLLSTNPSEWQPEVIQWLNQ